MYEASMPQPLISTLPPRAGLLDAMIASTASAKWVDLFLQGSDRHHAIDSAASALPSMGNREMQWPSVFAAIDFFHNDAILQCLQTLIGVKR